MSPAIEIFPSLADISEGFKGILLDAYGVFWGGNEFGLLPGAEKVMENMVSDGKIVGILSNSTQLASKETKKLEAHGVIKGKHFHFLLTSGELARNIFLYEKLPFQLLTKKFWVFGGVHPRFSSHEAIFNGTSYTETLDIYEADFIYIGIPHVNGEDQIEPEIFRQTVLELERKDIPMVCLNPDRFAHEGKPPKSVVRQGSIAKIYEEMGYSVYYVGKPYDLAYTFAMQNFHQHHIYSPSKILMVGDTPETDIRGARDFGMFSALTMQTGMMADRIMTHGLEKTIQSLPPSDYPDFFISQLTLLS